MRPGDETDRRSRAVAGRGLRAAAGFKVHELGAAAYRPGNWVRSSGAPARCGEGAATVRAFSVSGTRPSLAAIVETIVLAAGLLYVTERHGPVLLATCCLIAPLQLLRTARSNRVALVLFRSLCGRLGLQSWGVVLKVSAAIAGASALVGVVWTFVLEPGSLQGGGSWLVGVLLAAVYAAVALIASLAALSALLLAYVFVAAAFARWCGIAIGLATAPWETLAAMPRNWSTQVRCVDLSVVPELVPGLDVDEALGPRFGLRQIGRASPLPTWVPPTSKPGH